MRNTEIIMFPDCHCSTTSNSGARTSGIHSAFGTDLNWQDIEMHKLQSASDPQRVESRDQTNIETDSLLANQIISQKSLGLFAI